jgi:hypothetical protein
VDTLDQWTARGVIPHLKYNVLPNTGNRGRVLYLPSDLLAFRQSHMVKSRDIEAEVENLIAKSAKGN